MDDHVLVEWTSGARADADVGRVTVFSDGRVTLSERLGGGEHWISADDLAALNHFLFEEQRFMEIDPEALQGTMDAAAKRRQTAAGPGAEFFGGRQRDARTTRLRVGTPRGPHVVECFDLPGAAQTYPEVDALQRLRQIELRMIELAESLTRRTR